MSVYADPGDMGPPHAPTTAWVASAPFTRSSRNHSSRKSAALIVNSRTSSWRSRPFHPRNLASVAARLRQVRGAGEPVVTPADHDDVALGTAHGSYWNSVGRNGPVTTFSQESTGYDSATSPSTSATITDAPPRPPSEERIPAMTAI